MRKNIYCFCVLMHLFAISEINAQKAIPKPLLKTAIAKMTPIFKAENKEDTAAGNFFCFLKVVLNQKSIDLGKVEGHLNPVPPSDWKRHRIPKTAVATGTAFWAGLETTFYIHSTAKGWAVMRKYEDEQGDGKEKYELIKVLPFQNKK